MKVILFGGSGLLGQALRRQWRDDDVIAPSSHEADIRNFDQVSSAVDSSQADWIVLAAAYTDVDGCETNRQLAFDINTTGAANVAKAAKRFDSRLVFTSSDYVFDGTRERPYETGDAIAPRSVYGKSKAEAEKQILEILPQASIVRASWLFGTGGKCFPDTILKLAANRPAIDVVNDQRGSPTYAEDLAAAITQLCRKNAEGIVHVTNRGNCTWFDFAREIVLQAGLKTVVRPTSSDDFARPAPRPRYSVLSPASLDKYGITMPDWQSALRSYLEKRGKQIT